MSVSESALKKLRKDEIIGLDLIIRVNLILRWQVSEMNFLI